MLCVGIAVWKLGWLGGGDVKLIAALSLWAGPSHLAGLLLAIALGGGVLALAITVAAASCHRGNGDRPGRRGPQAAAVAGWRCRSRTGCSRPARHGGRRATVPYGVAVAVGGAWLLYRLFLA